MFLYMFVVNIYASYIISCARGFQNLDGSAAGPRELGWRGVLGAVCVVPESQKGKMPLIYNNRLQHFCLLRNREICELCKLL